MSTRAGARNAELFGWWRWCESFSSRSDEVSARPHGPKLRLTTWACGARPHNLKLNSKRCLGGDKPQSTRQCDEHRQLGFDSSNVVVGLSFSPPCVGISRDCGGLPLRRSRSSQSVLDDSSGPALSQSSNGPGLSGGALFSLLSGGGPGRFLGFWNARVGRSG